MLHNFQKLLYNKKTAVKDDKWIMVLSGIY